MRGTALISQQHPALLKALHTQLPLLLQGLSSAHPTAFHRTPRPAGAARDTSLRTGFPRRSRSGCPGAPLQPFQLGANLTSPAVRLGVVHGDGVVLSPQLPPAPLHCLHRPALQRSSLKKPSPRNLGTPKARSLLCFSFFFFPFLFLFQRNKNIGTFCVVSTFFWHFCVSLAACYCPLATLRRFCCSKRNQRKNLNFQVLPAIVFCFCLCY